jgi:hypothetical protein
MSPEHIYRQLIDDLSKTLGFSPFKDNSFSLTIGQQFDINIGFEESCEAIVFVSYLASLSDHSDTPSILRMLLEANYANQISPYGSLGLSPKSEDIVFSFKVPLYGLDLPTLLQIFEHIIAVSKHWHNRLKHHHSDKAVSQILVPGASFPDKNESELPTKISQQTAPLNNAFPATIRGIE